MLESAEGLNKKPASLNLPGFSVRLTLSLSPVAEKATGLFRFWLFVLGEEHGYRLEEHSNGATARESSSLTILQYRPTDRTTGDVMNRWRRIWLSVKLIAAAVACVAAAVQAFFYMLESQDAVQIHPLSIVVAGLIFGFISYGLLSLIERGVRRLVARFDTVAPDPRAELESDVGLVADQPLTLSSDASTHQKNL